MPTYATVEEVRAYVTPEAAVLLPTDDAELEALIEVAERDVDRVFSPTVERNAETGLKLTPADLTTAQTDALSRATAAAVEWRVLQGEDALVGAEDGIVAAGGVTFSPMPRPPAPKTIEELSGLGFPWRSGTVAPAPEDEEA